MDSRNVNDITNEINKVKSILEPMEKYLSDHPNDLSIEANVNSLNDRLNQLSQELSTIKNNIGLTTFDLYLSNVNGGKIKLSNLLKTGYQFQETLISCAMFDGSHPVNKKSAPTPDILNYSDPQIEIVQTNSLKIILSVADNQTRLSDNTPLKRGLENFNEIISCGDDRVKLSNLMEKIGVQPIFRYKKLLKILKDNDLNLDMYHSIIPKGFKTQKLSNEFAKKVYKVIDKSDAPIKEKKQITGELYQINSKTNKCNIEIMDTDTEKPKSISIKFEDSFKEVLRNKLYSEITVSIERTVEHTLTDDEINTPFDLVEIF